MKTLRDYIDEFKQEMNYKCMNYDDIPNELLAVPRIIVIGDIHGDMKVLIKCLEIAKVINNKRQWIGGSTVIVQVGDQIDSCRFNGVDSCNLPNNYGVDLPDDIKILFFMSKLHKKAIKHNGAVYSLMGNHELMNVMGDMTYVSHSNLKYLEKKDIDNNNYKNGIDIRKDLFKPGNTIASFLACTRKMALKIGSNLFVHGGIVNNINNMYNLNDMNGALKLYLLGLHNSNDFNNTFNNIFMNQDSPLWTREYNKLKKDKVSMRLERVEKDYSEGISRGDLSHSTIVNRGRVGDYSIEDENACNRVTELISKMYKVGRIYVGHTPQLDEGISSRCNRNVWLTDVAMSYSFDKLNHNGIKNKHRECQVLEILDDGREINILS